MLRMWGAVRDRDDKKCRGGKASRSAANASAAADHYDADARRHVVIVDRTGQARADMATSPVALLLLLRVSLL